MDWYDAVTYGRDRVTRAYRNYYDDTSSVLTIVTWKLIRNVAIFRVVCLWFGLASLVRNFVSRVGLKSLVDTHAVWFNGFSGIVSENLIWGIGQFFFELGAHLLGRMPNFVQFPYKVWIAASIVLPPIYFACCYFIQAQRNDFMDRWRKKRVEFTIEDRTVEALWDKRDVQVKDKELGMNIHKDLLAAAKSDEAPHHSGRRPCTRGRG